ncbi:alpha/beta hydrolase family protein [Agromyces italicus]|uniref:alpha/beta hydrolase family protein n=1 Tax=Agromyces italicus TaxID=279572 RepID=UPI0003B39BA5|nr:alpha/beta fold hydrolase [Agromyces italicus]
MALHGERDGAVRTVVGAAALLAAVIALVTGATAALLTVVFARRVVTPPTRREQDLRILGIDSAAGEITLAASDEARMRGRYGLWFEHDSGHARLGDVIEERDGRVRRAFTSTDFGRPERATRGRIDGWFHLGPWELDTPYEDVVVETPLGPAPAWWIPADRPSDRWVVQVHGRGAKRHEALRAVDAGHAAGWNSLLISYRNDGEAPESTDRRYGLGGTEWADAVAAVRYASEHGAREIVLMGWSMGGMISLQAVLRSAEVREHLVGVILDSPAIDWVDILRFQGGALGLPRRLGDVVARFLGAPYSGGLTGLAAPISLDELDPVARASEFSVPILLMHSIDDGFVPIDGSRRFAASRPDLIQFEEFRGARHTKLWNHDPERWNGLITGWLAARTVGDHDGAAAEIVG